MVEPRIVDAVTLRHFGIIDRMDILELRLHTYPLPRWTDAVRSEILDSIHEDGCATVLSATYLGDPGIPIDGLAEIFRIRRALSSGEQNPKAHLGEAESIWFVDKLNGTFITDDAEACAFAEKRFGGHRVLDTVELLRESVAAGELGPGEAKQVADAIRNTGRHLRAGHPPTLLPDYFG
jgi:hypothetical protein